MNTVDDRISAALRARAESLTEDDLSPALPPVGHWAQPARGRWTAPLLAAAVVGIAAAGTVTAVQLSRSDHASPARPTVSVHPTPSGVIPTPSASTPVPSQSASQPVPSKSASRPAPSHPASQPAPSQSASHPPALPPFKLAYQPLWPFGSYSEAEQWRTKDGGSQPWHLDAGQTALNFTRSYLGFTEIDQVGTSVLSDAGAHVDVGYLNPNGQLSVAATLHLVRYGDAADSPWEVVGSDDTTLTLEQPAYGSQVSSPMTIGGHITGVDENIVVSVLASQTDRATLARIPAGGDGSPWTTGEVSFTQRGVLTIVASTGGHVQQVERFAIQGVHT
ncbi:hypothetical protein [Jatrophihabitans sp.]|uniref:hypothetical protein n=1 Tax=Jatrophihabitans sp. TaxID=1932789 RepID=UPI002EEEDD2D